MPAYLTTLLQVAQVLVVLFSGAVTLWVYLRSRKDSERAALVKSVEGCAADIETLKSECADDIEKLKTTTGALSQRMALAEKAIAEAPAHRDLEGIRLQVATLNGHITALNERTSSTHKAVVRIENFLLGSKQ